MENLSIREAIEQGISIDKLDSLIKKYGYRNWNRGMQYAAYYGHKELVEYFISKGDDKLYYEGGILNAIPKNNKNIIDFFIELNTRVSWSLCLSNAMLHGHRELVDFFIEKDKEGKFSTIDWNHALGGAAEGGYKELVDLCIENGADDWNEGLNGAARGGHKELVDFFISKDSENIGEVNAQRLNLNNCMIHAAENGHFDLVEYFHTLGATSFVNSIEYAIRNGHTKIVEFLYNKFNVVIVDDTNNAFFKIDKHFNMEFLNCAVMAGNYYLVNYFIDKGCITYLSDALYHAAKCGHRDIIDLLISKGVKTWNLGMQGAARGGHKELVDFFISKGADDWDLGMIGAIKGNQRKLYKFFKNKKIDFTF